MRCAASTLGTETLQDVQVREHARRLLAQTFAGDTGAVAALIYLDEEPTGTQLLNTREVPHERCQRILEAPRPTETLKVPDDPDGVPHKSVGSDVATP